MGKKLIIASLILSSFLTFNQANASLFTLHVEQDNTSTGGININETVSFDSILDLFKQYEDGKLDSIIAGYNLNAASTGVINFRGIDLKIAYDNSSKLTFVIDSLGINKEFSGGSQEESFKQLTDYLKENKDGLLKKILKATIAETPYDAVAGNPNSLMNSMVDSTFTMNKRYSLNTLSSYLSPKASKHTIDYDGESKDINTLTLLIGFAFGFGKNDNWGLIFDMPISYSDNDGSKSYALQLGLGLEIPIISNYWKLTPSAKVGATASEDMLSGGVLYSFSLTSNVRIPLNKFLLEVTNSAGIIKDYSVKVGDYEIEYDLKNEFYKNGLKLTYGLTEHVDIGANYAFTFFTGSKLYIDSYSDLGAFLTYKFSKDRFIDGLSLAGNYSFGDNYKAYGIGISILF